MDYISSIIGDKKRDTDEIRRILDESLSEKDTVCSKSRRLLNSLGLKRDEALKLMALHKSSVKYGYDLSPESLSHMLALAKANESEVPLQRLVESPFFLVKACWLYEHAPYFLFYDESRSEDLDEFIIQFARQYDALLLRNNVVIDTWTKTKNPKRVRAVTFWENQTIDPVSIIEKIKDENIEGLELCVDFHPFNYTKLLPEELTIEKRAQIKQACRKSGVKIDIHSPIVGPYSPSPDPERGKQLFFDPLECFELLCETIELAKDIGAGSVVVHLIDTSNLKKMADLVMQAAGSEVRVTIENYCQTQKKMTSDLFIACVDDIFTALPSDVKEKNFGVTLDVGHLNIEGEDPLVAANNIGRWCHLNNVYLRLHATDNYGRLLFSPPVYSADIHGNVSGRGINNRLVIKLLRSMGHQIDVIAEQIKPLTEEDINTIHEVQSSPIEESYEAFIVKGKERLSAIGLEEIITPEITQEEAYQFLAGTEGIASLREHLIYRRIQNKKYLTVDEVKRISQEFMRMPQAYKKNLVAYVDDLLLPIQDERGVIQKSEIDLICQNISGAVFGTINNEHLNQIFSQTRTFDKGETICEQDTLGQEMFLIKEGGVVVSINGFTLAQLSPGEIFGEISLFYNVKRSATVKAAKDKTKIGILTRSGFETLLKRSQPYSYDLIYRLFSILPARLRILNDKYKNAIDALHLVLDNGKRKIAGVEHLQNEVIRPKEDLLPSFTQEEAQQLFQEQKILEANQSIFNEGDEGDGAYYIVDGKVKALTSSTDYKEIVLAELDNGEIFGEMALIDDKPRSASIVAVTPCSLAFIDKPRFDEFIETRSALAFRFMAFICLSLFSRILRLDKVYVEIKKAFQ
jgi:CRP-like cAMP-binding protein/sugar phosphate isomerase/epimerase